MTTPRLTIDLAKIEQNARAITQFCAGHGIQVTGITKGSCGHPEVAKAMLRGGVNNLGDSRLQNIHRMQQAGVDTDFWLIRLPPLSAVDAVIAAADASLNSELATLQALSESAQKSGKVHGVMLMVDLGDLREGLWPTELIPTVEVVLGLPGIHLRGLGTNLACFAGVVPGAQNMTRLVALAEELEQRFNIELELISALNSSGLELLAAGDMPKRVNHARIGEAILLGRETTRRRAWPGTSQDAFVLHAEVLELKTKPSQPQGNRAEDAFGGQPQFEDHGDIVHALLNLGRQDVDGGLLTPLDHGVRILGASSGYLILDLSKCVGEIGVGAELAFTPNYSALLHAMTSEYVSKQVHHG